MSYRLFFWVLICSVGSAAEGSVIISSSLSEQPVFLTTSEQRQVKVQRGQEAVLQCGGPADASVILLEWTRLDLKADGYVFFYRNKQFYEIYQLPSFHGRVALVNPQVRGGDFSVFLRNADISDSGSYECRVIISTPGQTTHSEIKRVMELKVTDPELTAGRLRGGGSQSRAGGAVAALALICLLLVVQ